MNLNFFYQKIGSVMKDNKFDREVTGYRSGALDTNRLYKSQLNSDRLFKRKQERQNKKYNVVLLIDESGSMSEEMGDSWNRVHWSIMWDYYRDSTSDEMRNGGQRLTRMEVAADLASLMVSGLEKNNIDFAVVGFNGEVKIHKPFDKPLQFGKRYELRNEIMKYGCGEGENGDNMLACNHDLFAVKEAQKLLKGRAGSNIVMVFSDGNPNCDYSSCRFGKGVHSGGKNVDKVRAEAHKLQKVSTFVSFGIGIDVSRVYPNAQRVDNQDEFMNKSIEVLNKLIKRG